VLAWWGRTVVRLRRWLLTAAAALALVGAGWGTGVFGTLGSGGFDAPGSESARAAQRITAEFGRTDADIVVLYTAPATVDDPAVRAQIGTAMDRLRARPEVARVVDAFAANAPQLVSADRHATYAAITLRAGTDDARRHDYRTLRPALALTGLGTQVGGAVALMDTAATLTEHDIAHGEALAIPLLLLVLLVVFRGVVAAAMPLLIGVLAILTALTTTRILAGLTDISTFAVNSITLLGLGMAIDYSLLIVSRFREELAAGHDTAAAVARTMATAGRAVLVSGAIIVLSLASLLIFPQVFLRSMGLGGSAAVLGAALAAVTVLPALLAILGPRINALRIPLPRPLRTGAGQGWARLAHAVMRHPVRTLIPVLAVLALLTLPFAHVRLGGADERVLPAGTPARAVAERIRAEFPHDIPTSPVRVLVEGPGAGRAAELVERIRALPAVTAAQVTAVHDGRAALVTVGFAGEPTGDGAYDTVRGIRALPAPPGTTLLVGGAPAVDLDLVTDLGARLPWLTLALVGVTMILLLLAFGSVVLPVKAVLMNLVSIGASFGAVVWVFQDGHLSGVLGFTPTGYLEPNLPVLIFAVLFGLSTDYEVFLLSRVREAWEHTGDNRTAVATGLQRTGRIITAAALLLVLVVAGFTTGQVVFAKLIGIGMITAVVVDATLVRTLLVPATMRLLGRWNWWAPRPLARLHRRTGLQDTTPAPAAGAATPTPEAAR
jgi:uncharacterized membrane protein YdfJ with MMPL/SSD domain